MITDLKFSDCVVAHIQTATPQAGRACELRRPPEYGTIIIIIIIMPPYLARKFSMVVVAWSSARAVCDLHTYAVHETHNRCSSTMEKK